MINMVKSIKRKEIGIILFYTQYEKAQEDNNISLNIILQTCYFGTTILRYFFEKIKEETILKINYKLDK